MVFSSTLFIYGFAPLFFVSYFVARPAIRNYVLLAGSLLFYTTGAGNVVLILVISIFFNHWLGGRLYKRAGPRPVLLLAMGVGLNLAGLIYYK
jgi:alginate O-acetyltransferase complex protein AlgI